MKKILKVLLVILFVYILFLFLESKFFFIRDVKINSDTKLINEDIINSLKKLKGESIFSYNYSIIENELLNDIRIESVNIYPKYPDIVNVDISLRKAIGLIYFNEEFYFIDRNLNIFAYYNEIDGKELPIINLPNNEDLKLVEELKLILKEISSSKLYSKISEIYKEEDKYVAILLDGTKIYTNEEVTTKKYDISNQIYEDEIKKNELEYIELRFKDVVVK